MSLGSRRFQAEIFTAGLENGGLAHLIGDLARDNVELVVDMRRWPARHWRRCPPSELAPAIRADEMYYLHLPDLGPASSHWLPGGDRWRLDKRAYRRLLRAHDDPVAWVAGHALRHRTCIVSQFAAPNDDDRSILATAIAELAGLRALRLRSRPPGSIDLTRPLGWSDQGAGPRVGTVHALSGQPRDG